MAMAYHRSVDSAYAKFGRAPQHLNELRASVEAFRDRDPHVFYREITKHLFEPDSLVIKIFVRQKAAPPTVTWSLMVGDILTNLRAALDHAVYGHANARASLTSTQQQQMSYPIIEESLAWFGDPNASSRKLREGIRKTKYEPFVHPAVLSVVDQSQPFNVSDPRWHGINVLKALVNRDKHRSLRVVIYTTEEISVTRTAAAGYELIPRKDQAMEDGAWVGTARVQLPPPPVPSPIGLGPRRRWEAIPFDVNIGYIESVEIPGTGVKRSLLGAMERLTVDVGNLLDELKVAGC